MKKGYRKPPVCKRGHRRTPDNLYITKTTINGRVYESRKCLTCLREYMRDYMRLDRAAKKQEGDVR